MQLDDSHRKYKPHLHRPQALRQITVEPGGPATPMSAARLAAEAAFGAPVQALPAAHPPPVIVHRAKNLLPAASAVPAPSEPTPQPAAPPWPDGKAKVPRVFRVGTPMSQAAVTEPVPATDAAPLPAVTAGDGAIESAARISPRRRISADKRPGPVLQVYQAAAPETPDETGDGLSAALQAAGQNEVIAKEMAGLAAIFETIRYSQSFCLVDESVAGEWQRISRDIEALRQQIGATG